jgi:multisubunit Na+/H+ antiporter MnhB subunit
MAWLSALPAAVDLVLAVLLSWLAWRALNSRDLFRAVVLFIAFGVVLALVWVRLGAVDIALAEIALGAGVTGALLLAALASLGQPLRGEPAASARTAGVDNPPSRGTRLAVALLLLPVLAGLAVGVLSLSAAPPGLSAQVAARLADSGVAHPVTAVLLNFRGYDTLLELAVLLLALIGVWSLATAPYLGEADPEPVLAALSRLLAPLMILVAAYLVWAGAQAPGGAFQAGSVLGGAGVLLRLSGWRLPPGALGWPLRLALVLGVAVFAFIGVAGFALGGPLLGYPAGWAKPLILAIELAATLSIGAILAALFVGGRP